MQVSDPLNTLAFALNAAISNDLPAREYEYRGETRRSRPRRDDVDIHLFAQSWSDTALGFDQPMAGQSFCTAYTAVVTHERTACVYFAEGLAYSVDTRNPAFRKDLDARCLVSQAEAPARYGALLPTIQT